MIDRLCNQLNDKGIPVHTYTNPSLLNQGNDLRYHPEARPEKYDKRDGMSGDWREDAVRIILEQMSDMYVGEFGVSHLSTYETRCVDPSSFRWISTPFWGD